MKTDPITTDELIGELARIAHGHSPAKLQAQFRENLQLLVELAKLEERRDFEYSEGGRRVLRGLPH